MAQILKEEIKAKILDAAEKMFFTSGFRKTTMQQIATEAGIATGNIYKYFSNKNDLFNTIITDDFADELQELTRKRVKAFKNIDKDPIIEDMQNGTAGELLNYWIYNRVKTVIILDKSEGSKYESYYREYIDMIIAQSLENDKALIDNEKLWFTFNNKLNESIQGIIKILIHYSNEKDIRTAFEMNWAYHYAGIKAIISRYMK